MVVSDKGDRKVTLADHSLYREHDKRTNFVMSLPSIELERIVTYPKDVVKERALPPHI